MKIIKTNKKLYPILLAVPALIFYTIFTIIPFVMSVNYSFTDWNIKRFSEPVFNGIQNFQSIFSDTVFLRSLWNTLLFAFTTTILKTLFGLVLALVLKKGSKINNLMRTVFFMPCVISCMVVGIVFTSILSSDGMLNTFLASIGLSAITQEWLGIYQTAMGSVIFIEGWMWAGFSMFIFISGLQAIPVDYYEYSETEGISKWNQFRYITLPLLAPTFTVVVTISLTGSLKVFDLIYVLTNGGPGYDTQVMTTFSCRAFGQGLLGQSCAASLVLTILVVCISFMLNKIMVGKELEM